jgi:hypothetical protein
MTFDVGKLNAGILGDDDVNQVHWIPDNAHIGGSHLGAIPEIDRAQAPCPPDGGIRMGIRPYGADFIIESYLIPNVPIDHYGSSKTII